VVHRKTPLVFLPVREADDLDAVDDAAIVAQLFPDPVGYLVREDFFCFLGEFQHV